jgi:hypothetical protein
MELLSLVANQALEPPEWLALTFKNAVHLFTLLAQEAFLSKPEEMFHKV